MHLCSVFISHTLQSGQNDSLWQLAFFRPFLHETTVILGCFTDDLVPLCIFAVETSEDALDPFSLVVDFRAFILQVKLGKPNILKAE